MHIAKPIVLIKAFLKNIAKTTAQGDAREESYYHDLSNFLEEFAQSIDKTKTQIPNHFHILIRIKPESAIEEHYLQIKKTKQFSREIIPDFIMECFSNFFNSYTKSYNKTYNRKGALFIDYLRRVELKDETQFWSNYILYS